MKHARNTFGPYDDYGPYPSPYYPPNKQGKPPPPLRGPRGSWKRNAVLDASDPAAAIFLAARKGNLGFLAKQPPGKLLLLDGNGDSVITHAVDSGNMLSF